MTQMTQNKYRVLLSVYLIFAILYLVFALGGTEGNSFSSYILTSITLIVIGPTVFMVFKGVVQLRDEVDLLKRQLSTLQDNASSPDSAEG